MEDRKIYPIDISFLYCFPMSRVSFEKWKIDSDFFYKQIMPKVGVHGSRSAWDVYYKWLLSFYLKVKKRYGNLGISFVEECSLESYNSELQKRKKLIIIFAHNCDPPGYQDFERLEFFDKRVSTKELQAITPADYQGLVDFSTCHLSYAPLKFKETHSKLITKSIPEVEIYLVDWLYFYSHLFEIVHHTPGTLAENYQKALINSSKIKSMDIQQAVSQYLNLKLTTPAPGLKGGGAKPLPLEILDKEQMLDKSAEQRQTFKDFADEYSSSKRRALNFCFVMIGLSFAVLVLLIILYRHDKTLVIGICCGEGALLTFLVHRSIALLKDVTKAELLAKSAAFIRSEEDFRAYLEAISKL